MEALVVVDWCKPCGHLTIFRMHAALQVLQETLQQTAVQREATISSDADGRGVTEDEQCAALKVLEVMVHICPCNNLLGPYFIREDSAMFQLHSAVMWRCNPRCVIATGHVPAFCQHKGACRGERHPGVIARKAGGGRC